MGRLIVPRGTAQAVAGGALGVARDQQHAVADYAAYRFHPVNYIRDLLGWEPWSGGNAGPGQVEILEGYALALRQQHERRDYAAGLLTQDQLTCWQPGQVIQNRIRVPAAYNVGKTMVGAGMVNHFFDCFVPSVIYTFAPSWRQIHDLLWKEIKDARRGKGLPGRILDMRLERGDKHFAVGKATDNAGGIGITRVQGQHGPYVMMVLDEAEGIPDFVFEAVDTMTSGGICIVLLLANPQTRTSTFHHQGERPDSVTYPISSLYFPNVREGREIIAGAVSRDYVEAQMAAHCQVVDQHDDELLTFEAPWRPGTIYAPDPTFQWQVLGHAPALGGDDTMIPVGVYEAATKRRVTDDPGDPTTLTVGVDVARFGSDIGTCYARRGMVVWREAEFAQQDTLQYWRALRELVLREVAAGVRHVDIRIDGGGGFGGGIIDLLRGDVELLTTVPDLTVWEVHFGGRPYRWNAYADLVTEMYAEAGEALKGLILGDVPAKLEADLCERRYQMAHFQGVAVRRLERKEAYRARRKRSPDDGDGFVLCVAPHYLFDRPEETVVEIAFDPVTIGAQL
jgi:hypothetical protein